MTALWLANLIRFNIVHTMRVHSLRFFLFCVVLSQATVNLSQKMTSEMCHFPTGNIIHFVDLQPLNSILWCWPQCCFFQDANGMQDYSSIQEHAQKPVNRTIEKTRPLCRLVLNTTAKGKHASFTGSAQ